MKFKKITVTDAGEYGFNGTVYNEIGDQIYQTANYHSAHGAFNVAFLWAEKQERKHEAV